MVGLQAAACLVMSCAVVYLAQWPSLSRDGVALGGVGHVAVHAACGGGQSGGTGVCSGGDRAASPIIISQCTVVLACPWSSAVSS